MDNIFLFIVGIFMIVFYANRGGDRESIEGFNDIGKMTVTDLQNLIYSTYKADVQAIKNLADTAAKLQAGGLTVPGNLTVSGGLTVNGNISGPTVNDLNNKITNAINTLNTNINNTKNDLINRVNDANNNTNNKCNALSSRIDNLLSGNVTIGGNLIVRGGNIYWKHGYDDAYSRIYTDNYRGGSIVFFKTDGADHGRLDSGGFWLSSNGVRLDGCDRRIKENIKEVDSNEILDKIIKLPLLNYNFIDKDYYEGKTVYGLIAQEVRKILPEAVTIRKEYIPNIYKYADSICAMEDVIELDINHNTELKINDSLQITVNNNVYYVDIVKFTDTSITVTKWLNYNETDNIFIYGTMIDDFHGLNQPYLGVLCMGGIQGLSKKVLQLENENNQLKLRLDRLEKLLEKTSS
jgi:hypothetical protein